MQPLLFYRQYRTAYTDIPNGGMIFIQGCARLSKEFVFRYRYHVVLCLLTIILLSLMEMRHPYFFLQDDNRDQFLPYYVHNLRAVMGGELPLFNFHQHLGTPVSIQYAAFYPLNYLATFLSKLLLGHYFGTMEFIAAFHLVMAACGFYALMRTFGLDEISCGFGAVAWTFCGFVITVGNSWVYILGYAAYVPWILAYSIKQIYRFRLRNFLILAGLKVMSLLLGNPQFFVYTVTFECLTVISLYFLVHAQDSSSSVLSPVQGGGCILPFGRFILAFFANYAVVIVLALPMLLQAAHQVGMSFDRQTELSLAAYTAFSYNLTYWFKGLVLPFLEPEYKTMGEQHFISHVGYLTLLFAGGALFTIRNRERGLYVALVAVVGGIALLWASDSFVTRILYYIPVVNRFRWPFKLGFFVSFYLIMLGTFGFGQFRDTIRRSGWYGLRSVTVLTTVLLLLHLMNFVMIHAVLPQHMLSRHEDAVPFDEPLKGTLHDGRIVSVGPDVVRNGDQTLWGHSVPSLGFNYATLWGLYHFGGYDGLLPEKNFRTTLGMNWRSDFNVAPGTVLDFLNAVPKGYFRTWGVKWYVIDRQVEVTNLGDLRLVASDRFRNVWHDAAGRQFAYWSDGAAGDSVRYAFRTNSMKIDTQRIAGGQLIVNVLFNPYFVATVDGMQAELAETDDLQMSITVPKGSHSVEVAYQDRDLRRGCMITLAFLVSAVFAAFMVTLKRRRTQDR
jgi:hypothetical protein